MKAITLPAQSQLAKFVPKAHGAVQNGLTGVGFGRIARRFDNVVLKGTLQRIGITAPIIKIRLDIIDTFNYAIHAGGLKVKKEGFYAVGADKLVDTSFNIPNFEVPQSFDQAIAQAQSFEAEF